MSCKKIDDIFSYLKELENKGYLGVAPENHQIQTLKFELRYMRMHLKWHTTLYDPLLCNMRTWVDDVEMCLRQSTRQGSMTSKVSGGKFYNLMVIMKVGKAILRKQCSLYYEDEQYGLNLSCKGVQIEELLLECIDPLLENLKHLVQCNDLNLLVFPKKQIEAIAEKLRSLKKFLEITGADKVLDVLKNVTPKQELLNKRLDLFSRIKRLVENEIYAFCYTWAKGKVTRIKRLFFDMKVKIDHIEPEVRLTYVQLLKASKIPNPGSLGIDLLALAAVDTLLDNLQTLPKEQDTIGSTDPLDVQQIESLQQELSLIKYFLLSPKLKQYFETEPGSFNSLLMQVEFSARGAASHTHSIYSGLKRDEMNLQYSNLVKILDLFKAKIKEIYDGVSKPPIPNFPEIPKFGFLEFFLQKLDELLKNRADSITYVKKEIEVVQTELGHLMYFTSETIKKPRKEKWPSMDKEERRKNFVQMNKEIDRENLLRLILKVAYEAEHVIDSISTSNIPNWYHLMWLSDVIENIQKLRKNSIEVFDKNSWNSNLLNVEKASSTHDSPMAYNLTTEEVVVGFEDQVELIVHHLLGGTEHLYIVSIVGMPGLGKTTVARKVYEHTSVTRYFDLRSWYCISQAYDRHDLLLSILADVTELSEEIGEMDDKDLAEALHKSLRQRRYLIVLDDIWSIHPWDDVRNLFPDDSKGSRILFTSRMLDLGFRANPTCVIHHLRFLTAYESWELLENKVFNRRGCPPELYVIGNDIVEKCEGLPLSLVLLAGALRLEETKEHWIQVLESIGGLKSGDSTDALNLSYKYLTDSLKPCFLYLGAFPEDKEIPTWKLLRMWIAEGFVRPKNSSISLENVAEGYLMELIARGLLLIGQNKSSRGVKSCRVHDVLREFSAMKAEEEKFLVISHEMGKLKKYRHFFYCKHFLGDMPSDPYIRSLIFFPTEKKSLSLFSNIFCNLNAFDLSVLPYILKLLRVLDLEHVHLYSAKFPADVELLIHLRYLAVQGRMKHVPLSVANLWRLETFRVVGTGGQVMLPETLLGMAYLKHLYVRNEATFELSDTFEPQNSSESDGIEKLSTISLRHGDCTTQKILRSLRSARKLKCVFLESPDCSVSCSTFPALNLLNKLESLNLTYQGNVRVQHPCDLTFPSNLKKVTLSNFCLPWSEISKLGRLPQLEVLKLLFRAFEGREWDSGHEKFGNLKFLKLESLDMVKWNASPFAFPCLEQIVLKKCWRLQELPSSFGELATLKIIQVQWCSDSVIQSVNKIQEKKQELQGGDELKVLIQQLA